MRPILILIAILWCALARAEEPQEARARALQSDGAALMQAGELLRARTAFSAAQALVPGRANPYRWLGLVDALLGRCEDARRSLDVFIEKAAPGDPRLPEARAARDGCQERLPAAPAKAETPPPAAAAPSPAAALPVAAAALTIGNSPAEKSMEKAHRRPLYRAWWLWTAVGVAAAGAAVAVGLGFGLSQGPGTPFEPIHVH